MNSKSLILIDALLSFFVLTLSFIFRLKNKIFAKTIQSKKEKKILIIKFLGAGNLIAICNVLKDQRPTIVTVTSNISAINEFIPHSEIIAINNRNPFYLISSCFFAITKLFISKYRYVINLEAESSFAKLIASCPMSYETNGLSNKYKSFFDWFFYDYLLVSPNDVCKDRILELLLKKTSPTLNLNSKFSFNSKNANENCVINKSHNMLLISPTCSLTDNNRRLDSSTWFQIISLFSKKFKKIVISFPSKDDPQYNEFLFNIHDSSKISIRIDPYSIFKDMIASSDLIITIDSQALHIAQNLSKNVICFYGPTSPYGVHLSKNTYVISKGFECSPCTHKYFKIPCGGSIDCMKYKNSELLNIFKPFL